jgi:hypothetical protein
LPSSSVGVNGLKLRVLIKKPKSYIIKFFNFV